MRHARVIASWVAPLLLIAACKEQSASPPQLDRLPVDKLKDPETCKGCHPTHYREWQASMHAYATVDPVFVAMNKLGQEETNGELGTFCVNCHAPMAVQEGLTDGSPESVEDLPEHMRGVTCYFCHNATDVEGETNAEVTLANDDVMRGSIASDDAIEPKAHGVARSRFMVSGVPDNSRFCGGCHDIKTDSGVHLERTYAEYQETIFAKQPGFQSCASCHMPSLRQGLIATETGRDGQTLRTRSLHSHLWPGVDVAVSDWHDREAYEAAVQCALDGSIRVVDATMDDMPDRGLRYFIETTNSGHNMPSGASQDRRLWVEVKMFGPDSDEPLCTSGAVPDDVAVAGFQEPEFLCDTTPEGMSLYRDRVFDENGEETHMFWRAAPSDAAESGVISNLLPAAKERISDTMIAPHWDEIFLRPFPGATKITVRMRMRPIDHDVIEELVQEGVLDESAHDEVRTFTIADTEGEYLLEGNEFVWHPTPSRTTDCYDAFVCGFDEDAPGCD